METLKQKREKGLQRMEFSLSQFFFPSSRLVGILCHATEKLKKSSSVHTFHLKSHPKQKPFDRNLANLLDFLNFKMGSTTEGKLGVITGEMPSNGSGSFTRALADLCGRSEVYFRRFCRSFLRFKAGKWTFAENCPI